MIYVDVRHGSRQRGQVAHHDLAPLLKRAGIEAESAPLESGDVMFMGNGPDDKQLMIGVEVKTIDDFIISMSDSRLEKQIRAMVEYGYDRVYLLIIGSIRTSLRGTVEVERVGRNGRTYWQESQWTKRPVTYTGVIGYIARIEEFYGARVRWVNTDHEAVDAVGQLYRWWNKQWSSHSANRLMQGGEPPKKQMFSRPAFRAEVVNLIPGFGWDRATAAAKQFPTLADMILASVKDWKEVKGVGKKMAEKAVEFLSK